MKLKFITVEMTIFAAILLAGTAGCLAAAGEASWQKPFEPDTNTVALWHCDGRGNDPVLDASSHQNHGRLYGLHGHERKPAAAYGEGKFKQGIECCDSGWVDIPDQKYYAGMNRLTVEAWVFIYNPKDETGNTTSRLGEIIATPGYVLRLTEDAARLEFVVHTEKGISSVTSKPMPFDDWHHIAATYDGKECYIFIDGQLADEKKETKGEGRIISTRPARKPDPVRDSLAWHVYSPVTLGGGVCPIRAVIDEVRISDCVRYETK